MLGFISHGHSLDMDLKRYFSGKSEKEEEGEGERGGRGSVIRALPWTEKYRPRTVGDVQQQGGCAVEFVCVF
jgi:hypothetical protein